MSELISFNVVICRKHVPSSSLSDLCRTENELLLRDKTFLLTEVKEFNVINEVLMAGMYFRGFMLQGVLLMNNGEAYHVGKLDTENLRNLLKPYAFRTSKYPVIQTNVRGKDVKAINRKYEFFKL